MASNNQVKQNSAVGVPAGAQTASQDYAVPGQSAHAMNTSQKDPPLEGGQRKPSLTLSIEERLESKEGTLPPLPEANHDDAKNIRPPGAEDAGGNKIHRKSFFKKLLHWEHNGMNAD